MLSALHCVLLAATGYMVVLMSSKIEIPLELAWDLAVYLENSPSKNARLWGKELLALLAATAVERQESVSVKRFNIYACLHHTSSWGEPCTVAELDIKEAPAGEWVRFEELSK